MTIQAVFFDMGGTIETFTHTREFRLSATPGLQDLLSTAGIELNLTDKQLLDVILDGMRRYHEWRMETLQEIPAAKIWRDYILPGYPIDQNILDEIAEELMFYYEDRFYQRIMRPEIPSVLESIRIMGPKIGLISNVTSREVVPANLKQYGIYHYFDPIVLSSEYGRRKPDPAIFHYAARLANVPTSQCLYVGDRIARDVVGARRAGYRLAIQIQHDYDHGETDEGATPDAVIHSMTDLLDIIRAENQPSTESTPPNPIRAILFDAGDILYSRPERGRKLTAFLQELGLNQVDNDAVQKQKVTDQAYMGNITQDQYRETLLRLHGVSQPEQIERGKQILDDEDHDLQFFEGVAQTLSVLKEKGYLLGVITDTSNPLYVKLNWFERGGFGDVWDVIISSYELGVRKPHPDIYGAALQQLGLAAGQAVFVGHKAEELAGARRVGMKTIAFNYEDKAVADFYIHRFTDLLATPFTV